MADTTSAGSGAEDRTLVVDTDVHEYLRSGLDLLPHLDTQWHRFLTDNVLFQSPKIPSGFPFAGAPTNRLDWSTDDGPPGTSIEGLRAHILDSGVADVVMLNGFYHVSALDSQPGLAKALASAYNDWQIAQWVDRDPRVMGSVHVCAGDPDAAVREIKRVAAHPQVVQVFLPTVINRSYGDPYYYPIYEAAAEHGLGVTFHHGPHTQPAGGYPRYYAEWHSLASPQAAMVQLASLAFSGALDRFAPLKFSFLESTIGWVPWAMGTMDENARSLRSEVPWLTRLPSESIRESVRFSTQPMADTPPKLFAQIVEQCGTDDMFMFSSDYPHFDGDEPNTAFPRSLRPELRERVLSGNALGAFPRLPALVEAL